ncbi:ATP-binding protein [Actinocatenispora rupis]|uniref:ATP-binding protein n=1 Tax=Actinocatenispora rupis TaxID=519421 RepID=UPI001EF1A340|nr:ATP-binding protein [Actinocatenispora rupis]
MATAPPHQLPPYPPPRPYQPGPAYAPPGYVPPGATGRPRGRAYAPPGPVPPVAPRPTPQPPVPAGPRLSRATNGRALAGVAAGIAHHLRVPVIAVRLVFVVLIVAYGLGAILYAAFWAVLPVDGAPKTSRRDLGQLAALAAVGVGLLVLFGMVGWGGTALLVGLLTAVVAMGAGVIWHQADPDRRRRMEEAGVPDLSFLGRIGDRVGDRRAMILRFGGGALLVAVGIIGLVAITTATGPIRSAGSGVGWNAILNGLLFALIAVAGITVVFGPLLWRSMGQLRTEREARIRETERAEIAAMVHDQVLHTLALIQRNAQDSREVQRLARGQERTLRNWLYKPTASPAEKLGAALEEASAEVEDSFALSVDTVVVGDCDVDSDIAALAAAAREAMVNAGKHAGVETVSLYAEVEPEQVSVFVRDRGVGFDPAAVRDDRHGVQGSIIGRMERHGGRAEIRSTPGEGTEIRLFMPRKAEDSKGDRP